MIIKKILFVALSLLPLVSSAAQSDHKQLGNYEVDKLLAGGLTVVVDNVHSAVTSLTEQERKSYQDFKRKVNAKLNLGELKQVLHFKTASHTLHENAVNYINNMIIGLDNYDKLSYSIVGYADARGDAQYNQKLSLARGDEVKRILISMGVDAHRISVVSVGEKSSKLQKSHEDYFFDRKVELLIKKQ
jgi:outer membrane protein OmpA-like peptidoglycan-associated protein